MCVMKVSNSMQNFIKNNGSITDLYNNGGSSLTNEKDHHYFLNRFVCVGEFFDG